MQRAAGLALPRRARPASASAWPSPPPVERLIASLRRLPGIGEKSATRLAFFLLSAPERAASRSWPTRSRA